MIRRRRNEELVPRGYWGPFSSSPWGMLEEMDRLFDDLRAGFQNYMVPPRIDTAMSIRAPAVDLIDEGSEYKLLAEIPGVKKEDIKIELSEKDIEISAEVKLEEKEEDKEKGYIRRERRYSKFSRRIPLPDAIQTDKSEAELKDGVLTITLPKTTPSEKKVKKVQVK